MKVWWFQENFQGIPLSLSDGENLHVGGGTRRAPRFKALRMHNKKLLPHYKVIQGRLHTT